MSIEEAGLKEMDMMNKWQDKNVKLMEEANSAWHKDSRKIGPSEEEDEDDYMSYLSYIKHGASLAG